VYLEIFRNILLFGVRSESVVFALHVVVALYHHRLPDVKKKFAVQVKIEHCKENSIDDSEDSKYFKEEFCQFIHIVCPYEFIIFVAL
jgi:uncharacterized membrane protein